MPVLILLQNVAEFWQRYQRMGFQTGAYFEVGEWTRKDGDSRCDQAPQNVNWLGKLALLHLGADWSERPDGLDFFSRLIEEHNELFGLY
jgi:hypothetical protein